jgi:hypothetical protein
MHRRGWQYGLIIAGATATLLVVLSCGASGAAVRQGWLRPPDIDMQIVDPSVGQVTSFSTGCITRGSRLVSRYFVVLYTPFTARLSLPIGHVLVNTWVPCQVPGAL